MLRPLYVVGKRESLPPIFFAISRSTNSLNFGVHNGTLFPLHMATLSIYNNYIKHTHAHRRLAD